MTASSLIGTWVLAGTGLLFLLIFAGTGYRLYLRRRPLGYKRLSRINRIVGWSRIGFVVLGLGAAVRVAWRGNNYQTVLVAPCAWAVVVLLGVIGTDFFLFDRSRYSHSDKPKVRISVCLPWTLILLLLLLLAIVWTGTKWGEQTASIDQRSHVYSWVLDGVFGWGLKTPYPGTFYTTPLLYCLPVVLGVGLCGIILVLMRRAWLPSAKYAALNDGFRARTIRDIVLTCVGTVSSVLAMMGLDIAWAFSTLGPGSNGRALVVAVAFFVGAWNLGQTFWVLANLIFLPPVAEDRYLAEQIRAAAMAQVESVSIPYEGELLVPLIPEIEVLEPEIEIVEGEIEILEPEPPIIEAEIEAIEEESETAETETEEEMPEPEGEVLKEETPEPEAKVLEEEVTPEPEVIEPETQAEPVVVESEVSQSTQSEITVEPVTTTEPVPANGPVPAAESVTTDEPVTVVPPKHVPVKSSATHRPGFKPKKKKPRRR